MIRTGLLLVALQGAIVAADPGVEAYTGGAQALARGDARGALQRLDEARRLLGAHPDIQALRAVALHRLGRLAEARMAAEEALAGETRHRPRCLLVAGDSAARLGDASAAAGHFSALLSGFPNSPEAAAVRTAAGPQPAGALTCEPQPWRAWVWSLVEHRDEILAQNERPDLDGDDSDLRVAAGAGARHRWGSSVVWDAVGEAWWERYADQDAIEAAEFGAELGSELPLSGGDRLRVAILAGWTREDWSVSGWRAGATLRWTHQLTMGWEAEVQGGGVVERHDAEADDLDGTVWSAQVQTQRVTGGQGWTWLRARLGGWYEDREADELSEMGGEAAGDARWTWSESWSAGLHLRAGASTFGGADSWRQGRRSDAWASAALALRWRFSESWDLEPYVREAWKDSSEPELDYTQSVVGAQVSVWW